MSLSEKIDRIKEKVAPEEVTDIIDSDGSWIVCVCDDEGNRPFHQPYIIKQGKFSYCDINDVIDGTVDEQIKRGRVIYYDHSLMKSSEETVGDNQKNSRSDSLMSASELATAFNSVISKNGDNEQKYLDRYLKNDIIKLRTQSTSAEAFQALEPEDIAFIAEEFGVDVSDATEGELRAVMAMLRMDGGSGSGNHGHKGVKGQRGGSAPSDKQSHSGSLENRHYSDVLKMRTSQGEALTKWMDSTAGKEHEKWMGAFSDTDYEIISGTGNDSYYDPNEKKVYLEDSASAYTASHETAHAMDDGAIQKTVEETIGKKTYSYQINSASMNIQELCRGTNGDDVENFASLLGVGSKDGWFDCSSTDLVEAYLDFSDKIVQQYPGQEEAFSCVSDILDGISESEIVGSASYGGHSKGYWQQSVTGDDARYLYKESWADFCALKLSKSDDMLGVLKKCVPNLYDALDKTYKEVFE